MTKKKISSFGGLVYSTDSNFKLPDEDVKEQEIIEPAYQNLRIRLDKKHRAGKAVTLVEGFIGTLPHIEELGKKLKSFCGTGGTVKEDAIIIQGDNREKILQWLQKNGYKLSKRE